MLFFIELKYLKEERFMGLDMEKEFEKRIEKYMKRIESAKSIEEALNILSEMRVYLTGIIDSETDPLWKTIGSLFIHQLQLSEAFLTLAASINQRLTKLEERVARIESELELRGKYR
jgi:hypothetical protein